MRPLPLLAAGFLLTTNLSVLPHVHAAGCAPDAGGGDWTRYGQDLANARTQPAEAQLTPSAVTGLAPAWIFDTATRGDGGGFNNTPVESGGCVYLATGAGTVYALSVADGSLVWSRALDVTVSGGGGDVVGSPVVDGTNLIVPVNQQADGISGNGPYATALDLQTGGVVWTSAPTSTYPGAYSNGSIQDLNGLLVWGFSPPEGDNNGTGGFAVIDGATGAVLARTPSVPAPDQALGYAGGGIWSTPAADPSTGFGYVGVGNPYSKVKEHRFTNAIVKIDLRRDSTTFGQIVDAYKGVVDQYSDAAQPLDQTPACIATQNMNVIVDNPVCGQIDLDFGASPNLFTDGDGHLRVGDLQKAGIYHAAYADNMEPAWKATVGGPCALCNASSGAYDGSALYVEAVPGGVLWSLNPNSGEPNWALPIGDGVHYEPISTADGVVYDIDGNGFLNMVDGTTGVLIAKRDLSQDAGTRVGGLTSAGVAIAQHTVFAATNASAGSGGFVIAYRLPA
jgi:outer membrane protein assembly factor BamB